MHPIKELTLPGFSVQAFCFFLFPDHQLWYIAISESSLYVSNIDCSWYASNYISLLLYNKEVMTVVYSYGPVALDNCVCLFCLQNKPISAWPTLLWSLLCIYNFGQKWLKAHKFITAWLLCRKESVSSGGFNESDDTDFSPLNLRLQDFQVCTTLRWQAVTLQAVVTHGGSWGATGPWGIGVPK